MCIDTFFLALHSKRVRRTLPCHGENTLVKEVLIVVSLVGYIPHAKTNRDQEAKKKSKARCEARTRDLEITFQSLVLLRVTRSTD